MAKRYRVTLTPDERDQLRGLISTGVGKARRLAHARVLLLADESDAAGPGAGRADADVAAAVGVTTRTVERVRARFVEQGLEAAVRDFTPGARLYRTKLDGAAEARLVALACSAPPDGKGRWTLRLLADRMVELAVVGAVSHETVRRALKKTS